MKDGSTQPEATHLAQLSEAARRFRTSGPNPASRGGRIWFGVALAAVATGAAIYLAVPGPCRFQMTFDGPEPWTAGDCAELANAVAGAIARINEQSPAPVHSWRLDLQARPPTLDVFTRSRPSGVYAQSRLGELLREAFVDARKADAGAATMPSADAGKRLADARRRAADARRRAEELTVRAATEDPRPGHRAARQRLEDAIEQCSNARRQYEARVAEHNALRDIDPARTAAVSDEDRTQALAADTPLRQDLSQLEVEISGLRKSRHEIRQETAAPLDDLRRAAVAWRDRTHEARPSEALDRARPELDAVYDAASAYVERLDAFLKDWTRLHGLLEEANDAAASFGLLGEIEQSARAGFFECGQRLEEGGAALQRLRETVGIGATLQTVLSDLLKLKADVESRHTELDDRLVRRRPLRVDAAVEAARRLEARIHERMSVLDAQLKEKAARRAAEEHASQLDRAAEAADQAKAALIELSMTLAPPAAEFLRTGAASLEHDRLVLAARTAAEDAARYEADVAALETEVAAALAAAPEKPRPLPTAAVVRPVAVDVAMKDRLLLSALGIAAVVITAAMVYRRQAAFAPRRYESP
ncbi:MAG: hypothetical protein FLDDKLPJ_03027 [Phycisphaerae bacterium]|nr:hypothetical protein [Phycisphaerae bacterium]